MPRKRGEFLPDSIAANPEAAQLLVNLISSGAVKSGSTAENVAYTRIIDKFFEESVRRNFVNDLLTY